MSTEISQKCVNGDLDRLPHAGCQPAPRPRLRHTPASGDVTVTNSSEVQIYDTREGSSSRHESINVARNKNNHCFYL